MLSAIARPLGWLRATWTALLGRGPREIDIGNGLVLLHDGDDRREVASNLIGFRVNVARGRMQLTLGDDNITVTGQSSVELAPGYRVVVHDVPEGTMDAPVTVLRDETPILLHRRCSL